MTRAYGTAAKDSTCCEYCYNYVTISCMGVYVVSSPPAEFGCGVPVVGGQCRDAHSQLGCSSLGGPPDEESLRRRRHQSGRTSCEREKVPI